MQKKGDDDQHGQIPTSQVISEPHGASSHFHEAPYTSVFNSNDATNIAEIVNVLSQVELPSPSPVQATCCTSTTEDNLITFHEGQSSGGKKDDETAVNAEQRETELKDKHNNLQEPRETQSLAHRKQYTERRRRSQIQEKIRVLKELVPDCNKRDQASILDDTIAYIKSLQMQLQMMQCMGAGAMPQSPYFTMRPMYEMGYVSIGHYGSYFPSNFPIFQPFTSRIGPSVPSIENFVGSPRLLQIPHQEFPSQTTERACSSTFSSDTILPATGDQVGSGISSQCSHRMQVTNQETHQASSARVREIPPKS